MRRKISEFNPVRLVLTVILLFSGIYSENVMAYNAELKELTGSYTESDGGYTINNTSGNNFVMSVTAAVAFSYEGKVSITEGDRISFVFGSTGRIENKWYGIEYCVLSGSEMQVRGFQEHVGEFMSSKKVTVDTTKPVPFKVEVTASGSVSVSVNGDVVGTQPITGYKPGRLGFLTWRSKATVSDLVVDIKDENGFDTNTVNWSQNAGADGAWMLTGEGLRSIGEGNSSCFSESAAANFIYEADMEMKAGSKCGGVAFRANNNRTIYYSVDIANDERQGARLLKFYRNPDNTTRDVTLGGANGNLTDKPGYVKKDKFHIRIEAVLSNINLYVDGNLIVSAVDSEVMSGAFGIANFNSDLVFQNVKFRALGTLPLLTGLKSEGVDLIPAHSPNLFGYEATTVPFNVSEVTLIPSANTGNKIFVNEKAVNSGSAVNVKLNEGQNAVIIRVEDEGSGASSVTTVNIKRKQNPETMYLENYRPQFHYSPERNWCNDPNGMVYYEGEYHLFYQYHPYSKQWGEMHWGHAVSPDMIHWEELPIALYPDRFGAMFSGSAVVDYNNTTGFFTDTPGKKGMVAIYTCAGPNELQQQSIAYSKDNGRTWIKYKDGEPVLKKEDDPVNSIHIRDPKVFWHPQSNKWMMAVAGGPLRFFSSPNLIDWTFESSYLEEQVIDGKRVSPINSECPDFFELPVEGGNETKWVMTGSGLFYIVGDFKEVNGKWMFIPDSNEQVKLNFGPDTYAAQTYNNTPDGRRIMINWMMNFAYFSDLAKITDPYNGIYSMQYELKLKREGDKIRLYQTPVEEYKMLRETPRVFKGIEVTPNGENPLKDIHSKQMEIVAEFTPGEANTQVGFKLRVGDRQETTLYYDNANKRVLLNRMKSGAMANTGFYGIYQQATELIGGKVKLNIFVDWSSVEVFVNDGVSTGTALVYPDPESTGMELFAKGGNAKVDITIYPLKRAWPGGVDSVEKVKNDSGLGARISTAGDMLRIELPESNDKYNVDVFNISGIPVHSKKFTGTGTQVILPHGVYIVRVSNMENIQVQKVLVR